MKTRYKVNDIFQPAGMPVLQVRAVNDLGVNDWHYCVQYTVDGKEVIGWMLCDLIDGLI
jgi:hypothetical protein